MTKNLDGNEAMQRDVSRKEHDAHTAAADFADHLELRAEVSPAGSARVPNAPAPPGGARRKSATRVCRRMDRRGTTGDS